MIDPRTHHAHNPKRVIFNIKHRTPDTFGKAGATRGPVKKKRFGRDVGFEKGGALLKTHGPKER